MSITDIKNVYCHQVSDAEYIECSPVAAPELSAGSVSHSASIALRSLLYESGYDRENYGTAKWSPLSEIISNQDTVLIKPNWVNDMNLSGGRIDCLITNIHLIETVLEYVLLCNPKKIVIGDAPVQACNFDALCNIGGINKLKAKFKDKIQIRDLRLIKRDKGSHVSEDNPDRSLDEYVLFDLGKASMLEPISADFASFRVACYDPCELRSAHALNKHQYLIAKEAIDADVVISMPKLKTHRKAGITGALKNMIGINGHKSYLPHHRKGSSANGGDCYKNYCLSKRLAESILDKKNSSKSLIYCRFLDYMLRMALKISEITGHGREIDGSWYGNDTVWRTCLDIQRILHYGCKDGTLSNNRQRTVLTITDGIIAGEGEGPLSPSPIQAGILTLGLNTAAIDYVHASLMGFDPRKIPLVREAIGNFDYPIAEFGAEDIVTFLNGTKTDITELVKKAGKPFIPPRGWQNHCEDHKYMQHTL